MHVPTEYSIREHDKTLDLAAMIHDDKDLEELSIATAVGLRVMLYTWCMEHLSDDSGELPNMTDFTWSRVLGVGEQDASRVLKHIKKAGVINTISPEPGVDLRDEYLVVCNWSKVAGKVLKKTSDKAEYMRNLRLKKKIDKLKAEGGDQEEIEKLEDELRSRTRGGTVEPRVKERGREKEKEKEKEKENNKSTRSREIPEDLIKYEKSIQDWFAYHKPYKAMALPKLWKHMRSLGDSLPSAVDHSIASGYQGLFAPNDGPKRQQREEKPPQGHIPKPSRAEQDAAFGIDREAVAEFCAASRFERQCWYEENSAWKCREPFLDDWVYGDKPDPSEPDVIFDDDAIEISRFMMFHRNDEAREVA